MTITDYKSIQNLVLQLRPVAIRRHLSQQGIQISGNFGIAESADQFVQIVRHAYNHNSNQSKEKLYEATFLKHNVKAMMYHNFSTGERIFDYQMKDKKLREIALENLYCEADHMAVQEVHDLKKNEWEDKFLSTMHNTII
eukprot:CAMPEP_0175036478 /NCGR_PEP_ID=MMETSP0005-20121125/23810_1 /TAXON_ID=420556 /ORGANISM="Ochromonas sp., Strain CCMP1393" /LENGTH=139 /DNA_ID=CAMNT_0016297677 /DNA_START=20 /DNA_END=440 /DNA_ORIENTATION=+